MMASKTIHSSEEVDDRTLPEFLYDVLTYPFHLLTSPLASRIYLRTVLLILSSFALLGLSIIAYALFYYSFIPALQFTIPIHLQFSPSQAFNPHALVRVPPGVVASQQEYDVMVRMCLPKIPENIDVGNFMIDAQIRGPEETITSTTSEPVSERKGAEEVTGMVAPVLASSSRPALLFPEDRLVALTRRLLQLPFLVTGWLTESHCLSVPIFEGVSFERGWRNQPDALRVKVAAQGGPKRTLRIEEASVEWTARFQGLRWFLWRWRITSFVVGVGAFWTTSMFASLIVWITFGYLWVMMRGSSKVKRQRDRVAEERGKMDTPQGLKSEDSLKIEDTEESSLLAPTKEEEADDEDEDADFVMEDSATAKALRDDSGLGTSLESSGPERIRRRRKDEGQGRP